MPCERHPLPDAEAVLLIHDHEAQPPEFHALLDERVRSDCDHRIPGRAEPVECVLPLTGRERTGEEHVPDVDTRSAQELPNGSSVLLGEQLRRGHQRGLVSALGSQEHREESHERLARTHIALEKAVHPPTRDHVGRDLTQHTRLRAREFEGKARVERADPPVGPAELDPRPQLCLPLPGERLDELE